MTQTQNNFLMRLVTAVVGAPIVLFMIWVSPLTTVALMLLVFILAVMEYRYVASHKPSPKYIHIFGIIYLAVPLFLGIWLRTTEDGVFWFLAVLATNWMTDIGAYLVGRKFGRTPLAPKISPKKTWEGFIGGLISGFATIMALVAIFHSPISAVTWLLGFLVPLATSAGDLIESKFKRYYGVKDSGFLLPGHGGILDRIDGTLLAIPVAVLIIGLVM